MWNPFKKKGNAMASAQARHILVGTEQEANDLKQQIESGGATFEDLAQAHSQCPSGKSGGDLGTFSQGQMVPEFDKVGFGDLPIGQVSEPVKTEFGYHILEVQQRMN